jgi:CO/xanthine dehydrogenase FAD-binding subunit
VKNFEYVKVKNLQEAIRLLSQNGVKAHILAGGTDVLVKMKQKQMSPDLLVDIKGLPGLKGIERLSEGGMRIGPLTTIHEIETSSAVRESLPVLSDAARGLGSVQVRHRATIGGNLCNALPSADIGPYLIGMGAWVNAIGPKGGRRLLVEELFLDSGKNSLQVGEIVTAIEIPPWTRNTGGAYIKHTIKNAVDVAMVSLAVVVMTDSLKKIFEDVKIIMGAVGPRPIRAVWAEDYLRGKVISEEIIVKAGELASRDARPRTTVEYKIEMVTVLTKRAIHQALERIDEG